MRVHLKKKNMQSNFVSLWKFKIILDLGRWGEAWCSLSWNGAAGHTDTQANVHETTDWLAYLRTFSMLYNIN